MQARASYIPSVKAIALLPFAFALAAAGTRLTAQTAELPPPERLARLFAEIDGFGRSPQDSLYQGVHPRSPWHPTTDAQARADADSLELFLTALNAIDSAGLTAQDHISRAVMRIRLSDQIDEVRYRMHLIPMNAEGGFYNRLAYTLDRLPFETIEDYERYLTWLPYYEDALRQNIRLLQQGVAEGIVAPQSVIANTLTLLEVWAVDEVSASPLYAPFGKTPAGFGGSRTALLLEKAQPVIAAINATYVQLADYIGGDYLAAAPELPGVGQLPNGLAYYENRVRHYTTLPLTADSVHRLGLVEVARIRRSMDSIITSVGFGGSFADFLKFLRTDPQFYASTPQELLNRAAWISKRAEGKLPRYFDRLYSLPFTVEPVPDAIAKTYTTGRYVGGSSAQRRAGIYWVNTYDLPSRTLYTLPALTLHEAVPGHHLQNVLAAEIEGLPEFRNRYYISAFGEGWGLYSEYLGEEMGMYETPYELFGRYTYEMWRACRLVIDTGIHGKGWTRQRALDYLADNTALSLHEVTTEVDRYIGWPGQAVSYKVGEIEIKRLRTVAEAALGDRFAIGAFHEAVLRNGSVPLGVLRAEVQKWLADVMETR